MSQSPYHGEAASPATGPAAGAAAAADAIAAAVLACPAVVELSGGTFGQAATYLPGRRVVGVRLSEAAVDVHVVGTYGTPVSILAQQVRTAAAPYAPGRAVNVRVEDVRTPAEPPAALPAGP